MKIKMSTPKILRTLYFLSWIIFTGLCIEAGGFIINAFFALVHPSAIPRLWKEVDLSGLFQSGHGYFFVVTLIMSIVAVMKVWLFFLIIKNLQNKKLNITKPFNMEIRHLIFLLSYISLIIGLFCLSGGKYIEWLVLKGIRVPDIQYLGLGGYDVWLFMAVILFVVGQVFKRGIEIQTENELTI